jgi:hypothetical protein
MIANDHILISSVGNFDLIVQKRFADVGAQPSRKRAHIFPSAILILEYPWGGNLVSAKK